MRYLLLVLSHGLISSQSMSAQPDAPRVRVVEDLRLDATAQDFPTVTRVYVGPAGQIVVPVQLDQQLRIYDAGGKRIASFGRKGAGPGEFTAMTGVGWSADTIWVLDRGQRRTTFIGPDYKLLRTEVWPQVDLSSREPGKIGAFDPFSQLPDASWLGQGFIFGDKNAAQGFLGLRSPRGDIRIVFRMPPMESDPRMMWVAGLGRMVPFSLQPQYSFAHNGSRWVELKAPIPQRQESDFSVNVFRPTGDTVFSRTYPFRGVPIPRRVVDSALAAMIPPSGRPTEGPPDGPQKWQAMARDRMSRWYIPVETITLGLDQTIWIGMRLTDAGRSYLILNGRGDPIGSLLLPRSSRLRQANATHVWVTETHDDGLTSVVRYRVEGLRCGSVPC